MLSRCCIAPLELHILQSEPTSAECVGASTTIDLSLQKERESNESGLGLWIWVCGCCTVHENWAILPRWGGGAYLYDGQEFIYNAHREHSPSNDSVSRVPLPACRSRGLLRLWRKTGEHLLTKKFYVPNTNLYEITWLVESDQYGPVTSGRQLMALLNDDTKRSFLLRARHDVPRTQPTTSQSSGSTRVENTQHGSLALADWETTSECSDALRRPWWPRGAAPAARASVGGCGARRLTGYRGRASAALPDWATISQLGYLLKLLRCAFWAAFRMTCYRLLPFGRREFELFFHMLSAALRKKSGNPEHRPGTYSPNAVHSLRRHEPATQNETSFQ